MRVGTIAKLAQDDSIALRIKFADKAPSGSEIYLRGPVLSAFDGREWLPRTELPSEKSEQSNLRVTGEPIRYEVTLEPQNKAWVFVLDAASKPPQLPNYGLSLNADMQWTANRPITELVRYQAQSHLQFTHGPAQMDDSLDKYLALPVNSNPRTVQMAATIKQNAFLANDTATTSLVSAAMQQLRAGGYEYTLEPGLYGEHTADQSSKHPKSRSQTTESIPPCSARCMTTCDITDFCFHDISNKFWVSPIHYELNSFF